MGDTKADASKMKSVTIMKARYEIKKFFASSLTPSFLQLNREYSEKNAKNAETTQLLQRDPKKPSSYFKYLLCKDLEVEISMLFSRLSSTESYEKS